MRMRPQTEARMAIGSVTAGAWRPRAAAARAFLLACIVAAAAGQEPIVLHGSGPRESAEFVRRAGLALEERAGVPVEVKYRALVTNAASQEDLLTVPRQADFIVSSGPLTEEQHTSAGGVLHVPFSIHSFAFFFNVPGAIPTLNMTACTVARILSGAITKWTAPEIKDLNPEYTHIGDPTINVILDTHDMAATHEIDDYLGSVGCPSVWKGTYVRPLPKEPIDAAYEVMHERNAFGYAITSAGTARSLRMVSLKSPEEGDFVTPRDANYTTTRTALQAKMPSTLASSFHDVSSWNMAGGHIYPLEMVNYLIMPVDQTGTGAKGAVLRALGELLLQDDMQELVQAMDPDILPVGPKIAAQLRSAIQSEVQLGAGVVPFTVEAPGAVEAVTDKKRLISGNREEYDTLAIKRLQERVTALEDGSVESSAKIVHGAGSSAMQLAIWRVHDRITSMSTSPLWMSYRPIGSGVGEQEFMGDGVEAFGDYTVSDVGLSSNSWALLKNQGVQVVHIPVCIVPMTFVFNLPATVLPSRRLRISPCTAAGILQGDITAWNHSAIAADNPGVALPGAPIRLAFRNATSGTTAVVSQYLANVCPTWKLGSGKQLRGWPASAYGASSAEDLGRYVARTPYAFGYIDASFRRQLGLSEADLPNKDGSWLRSSEADLQAAALSLFDSGGWPTDPSEDFSGVSLLDQPGNTTWPISVMPFILLRTDLTPVGEAGVLLSGFLTFLMTRFAQSQMDAVGFGQLPHEVVAYVEQRTLPLLRTDTAFRLWRMEMGPFPLPDGKATHINVISVFKSTYEYFAADRLNGLHMEELAAPPVKDTALQDSVAALEQKMKEKIESLNSELNDVTKLMNTYKSLAIAGIAFGGLGLFIGIFVGVRMFVLSASGGYVRQGSEGHISRTASRNPSFNAGAMGSFNMGNIGASKGDDNGAVDNDLSAPLAGGMSFGGMMRSSAAGPPAQSAMKQSSGGVGPS